MLKKHELKTFLSLPLSVDVQMNSLRYYFTWLLDMIFLMFIIVHSALRGLTTFCICFCISKNTPFYSLAIANHALGWCRGYPEVSFTGRLRFKKYMKMGKFHPFLKTLVFLQLASSCRSVLLTEQFSQRKKYISV